MIRLNIRRNGKIVTKSFMKKIDLDNFVLDFIGAGKNMNFTETSNKIWNGGVAETFNINGFAITINGKQRAGNVIMGYLKNAGKYDS